MTMNKNIDLTKEKAKAYDEAVERTKKSYDNGITEEIFSELKEGNDEKMRNFIINELACLRATNKKDSDRYEELTNVITWLENQGKQYTDKNNPKFNIGDWIIYIKSKSIYQVEKKENYEYTLRYILGGSLCLPFSNEKLIREWNIQDAKDGDILVCNEEILIFKSYSVLSKCIYFYCWYDAHTNKFHSKEVVDILSTIRNNICPATKEQHDLLFQKIKEAGYKWNAEIKTLENLIKPKFKVGDKIKHKETNNVYEIIKVYDNSYGIAGFNWGILIKYQDEYELVNNKFDPKTLKPFDKVLVRDNKNCTWMATIFSHINNAIIYPYICTNSAYKYCIPYNDDTKYLVGTTLEVSEFYRYWED